MLDAYPNTPDGNAAWLRDRLDDAGQLEHVENIAWLAVNELHKLPEFRELVRSYL